MPNQKAERLAALLGVELPIVQAPMAGVSTPELAAAVSNAGGLGSIAVGTVTIGEAAASVASLRRLTNKPFNVNLFVHERQTSEPAVESRWLERLKPFFAEFGASPPEKLKEIYGSFRGNAELLDLLCRTRPPVVSFHFGCPDQAAIDRLKSAGIVLLASASHPHEAEALERAGVDAIVAQGFEAGGHRGVFDSTGHDARLTTMTLVPQVVDAVRLPVIVAGGIMDGRGLAAALMLGASGVQMGTAFVPAPESAASAAYRRMLLGERARRTESTRAISGRAARAIANRLTDALKPVEDEAPAYPFAYDAAKHLAAAASAAGSPEFAAMWAGQGAPLARAEPAGEIVRRVYREAAALLRPA